MAEKRYAPEGSLIGTLENTACVSSLHGLERAMAQGFMKEACRNLCAWFNDPATLLDYLEQDAAAPMDVRHLKNI